MKLKNSVEYMFPKGSLEIRIVGRNTISYSYKKLNGSRCKMPLPINDILTYFCTIKWQRACS